MIKKLPVKIKSIEIGSLGFYEYSDCNKCLFSGLSKEKVFAEGELLPAAITKPLIIGRIYHNLLSRVERFKCEDSFQSDFSNIVNSYEDESSDFIKSSKLGPLHAWPEIVRIKRICLEIIDEKKKRYINGVKQNERIILSSCGRFKGIPDALTLSGDVAYITEYKSSSLYFEGSLKDQYVQQVIFYAMLVRENYGHIKRFVCRLESLSGEFESFEMSGPEIDAATIRFNSGYEQLCAMLDNHDIYDFSKENCISCNKRHVCDAYKERCHEVSSSKAIYVASGPLNKITKNKIKVDGKLINFTKDDHVLLQLDAVKAYTFVNLVKRKGDLFFVKESKIYEH